MAKIMIEKYERYFLYASIVLLVAFFAAIMLSIAEAGIHLPTRDDTLDPAAVDQTAPFDAPGVTQIGENQYRAVIVAATWQFTPSEIRVPKGSEVEFVLTSRDVIHGILIPQTTVNAMIIPGRVTRVTATFDEPGEHTIVCHEFCGLANEGIGHHSMFGTLVVEG